MQISWETFLARYLPLARNVASSLAGAGEAEDLVQEAVLALLAALGRDADRFRSLPHARNYLLRAVRNLALKQRQRTRPMKNLEEEPIMLDGADPATIERGRRLGRALRRLHRGEREYLARRFHRRQTLAQIAADTGQPISTLHAREKALLERLRRQVEAREEVG